MKPRVVALLSIVLVFGSGSLAYADLMDVTSESFDHFTTFENDDPAGAISVISRDTPATTYGDFGWHDSPSEHLPAYAGIHLDSSYAVTKLRFQVHMNPFSDFTLQGSNNSTTGTDGDWYGIYSSTVTERDELAWQEWEFTNDTSYSWYRIMVEDMYVGGWAMYRWELLADTTPVPGPATILLLGSGLLTMGRFRRRLTSQAR